MLPDLSRTRTTSKVLRPLKTALSAGATPSSVGSTAAGVSPVCFETCEHSESGAATTYVEMRNAVTSCAPEKRIGTFFSLAAAP